MSGDRPRGLAHLYAARKRRPLPDLFVTDQAEARGGGGFRWFFSTLLAGGVGMLAIGAVIFGSLEIAGGPGRIASSLHQAIPTARPQRVATRASVGGLAWTVPKSDRLQTTMDAVSTRYVVQDSIRERRANRDYLLKKPYARVVIRLAAVEPDPAVSIPPFNPLKLFASTATPKEGADGTTLAAAPEGGEVTVRIVELLGSILPTDDGQELDGSETLELVVRSIASEADRAQIRPSFAPEGLDLGRRATQGPAALAYTTVLHKTATETDEVTSDEAEAQRVKVKLGRGEPLSRLLVRMGADTFLARDMIEAGRGVLAESAVPPGSEVELTLVPSLSGGKPEPIRYTVIGPGGEHKITVERNAAGEFVASATPTRVTTPATAGDGAQSLSIYNSLYQGALAQGIPPETVQAILRVHAYESDFRRRARGSDAVELFFDIKEEDKGADGSLGELLVTAMTIGGSTQRFYRYKEQDGGIDFYDTNGNNSRRFLLRKPVRSDDVRLTSGFGIRFHPLLNQRKLHAGIDWAGPVGTPIIAAGNGTIEEAGYKGQYGNYVRIRHSNGYQTAYGHMRGVAPGMSAGVKVRQGQVIGYLGSSGLSSGPHLHFEVLVGNRWVDPLSIQVPREKRLAGRQLAAFQRERVRIDDLMRQPPVRVVNLESQR